MDVRIGCSGWSYQHWRGNFYPKGVAQSKWLESYAQSFDTVELNNSFYHLPSENAVRSWKDRVSGDFAYSVKASRLITHNKRLMNSDELLATFFVRMRLLGPRLGPILYQLPASFERDDERLAAFLRILPSDLVHVFEFRSESWWNAETYALLRAHGAAFCVYNMGEQTTPLIATSETSYVRMHGPGAGYASGYNDAQLEEWRQRIIELEGVKRTWVYFNNDVGGHAPVNALRLGELFDRQ